MKQDIGQAFVEFISCGRVVPQEEQITSSRLLGIRSFRSSIISSLLANTINQEHAEPGEIGTGADDQDADGSKIQTPNNNESVSTAADVTQVGTESKEFTSMGSLPPAENAPSRHDSHSIQM
jgi:hypothetical protein